MNRRQRRRRALMIRAAVFGPPLLISLCWLIGLLISPVHREETSRVYPSSPETIWGVLTDLDGMPAWRQDLVALERLPVGDSTVRWREVGARGARMALEWAEAVPPSRLVIRIAAPAGGEHRWVYRIRPLDAGTELAVIEEQAIRNPVLRTLIKVFGSDRDGIEALARDLATRLAGHRQRFAADLRR